MGKLMADNTRLELKPKNLAPSKMLWAREIWVMSQLQHGDIGCTDYNSFMHITRKETYVGGDPNGLSSIFVKNSFELSGYAATKRAPKDQANAVSYHARLQL